MQNKINDELKRGDRFKYKNITLEIKEGKGCAECYIIDKNCENSKCLPLCSLKERKDKKDIIFVKV